MANVLFKRGTQANLNALRNATDKTGIEDGTFYLTSDTHRLYVSLTDKSIVPVNEGITTVANIAALPKTGNNAGEFYYATNENVLCIYNGSEWVQINPDHNTNLDSVTYSVSVSNGTASIKTEVKMDDNTTKNDTFTIKGSDGTSVSASGKNITISSPTYSVKSAVSSNVATITLDASTGTDTSVTFKAGDHVGITKTGNDVIISSEVTSIDSVGIANNATAGFDISVKDTLSSAAKSATLNPVIAIGDDTTLTDNQVHFTNGTASLPVYSKADIDKKLMGLNAMTFRGVVDAATDIPTSDLHNGDTFKVGTAFGDYSVGDLLIAQGTEGNDGKIPAASVTYARISSGEGAVVTYAFENVTGGVQLKESGSTVRGKFTVSTGTSDALTLTDSGTNGTKNVQINHITAGTANAVTAETAATQAYNTDLSLTALTDITYDKYGHVSAVKSKKVTFKDTHNELDSLKVNASANTNKTTATITSTVASTDGGSKAGSYELSSSSLQIAATAATTTANAKVSVDMVWGSF